VKIKTSIKDVLDPQSMHEDYSFQVDHWIGCIVRKLERESPVPRWVREKLGFFCIEDIIME